MQGVDGAHATGNGPQGLRTVPPSQGAGFAGAFGMYHPCTGRQMGWAEGNRAIP